MRQKQLGIKCHVMSVTRIKNPNILMISCKGNKGYEIKILSFLPFIATEKAQKKYSYHKRSEKREHWIFNNIHKNK